MCDSLICLCAVVDEPALPNSGPASHIISIPRADNLMPVLRWCARLLTAYCRPINYAGTQVGGWLVRSNEYLRAENRYNKLVR